ncbi:MAG: right-handed parallel beta-helix repeat-containing protein [Acidobacteriia bacterium]|nr:right-handed parallel beta-helix repeat-containing protein [Terriglobia bacterium]
MPAKDNETTKVTEKTSTLCRHSHFSSRVPRVLLPTLLLVCLPAHAARYYLDATNGSDARSGLAAAEAWQSLAKANATVFQPGDELLLKRGERWHGSLQPQGSGTPAKPIRLGTYGEGARPVIDGGAAPAVLIHNQDAWIIESLEVTNQKDSKQDALKIWAGPRRPHYHFIRIRDCVAHDAGGSGIHVGEGSYGNYDDVVIEDCVSYNNLDSGIFIQGQDFAEVRNLAIRRSVAYGNGWDGIKIYSGRDGVIEYCTAYRNGWKQDARVGIWCWNSENIVIQYCESYENMTPGTADGGGFDIDWSCVHCIIQYCYSHDNDGAGYLFMGSGRGFTTRSAVRFNISLNDGRKNEYGGLLCYGTLQDSEVYNNLFYFEGAETGAAIHFRGTKEDGYPSNVRVFNNIVVAEQGRAVLRVATEAAKQNNTFDFNDYCSSSGLRMIWGGETYSDIAEFRRATRLEEHGLTADPRLKTGGTIVTGRLPLDGYRLLPDSPCRNSGTTYEAAFGNQDYWGKPLDHGKRLNIGPEQ